MNGDPEVRYSLSIYQINHLSDIVKNELLTWIEEQYLGLDRLTTVDVLKVVAQARHMDFIDIVNNGDVITIKRKGKANGSEPIT
jgi:hypothetical protein